jgi:hypothetical protein
MPIGRAYIASIRGVINVARSIVEHSNITQHVEARVFPDSDEEIDYRILEHVFGMLGSYVLSKYLNAVCRRLCLLHQPNGY